MVKHHTRFVTYITWCWYNMHEAALNTLSSILLGIRITVFSAIWASFELWCDMLRSMSISQIRAECIKFLSEYHDKNLKLAS